jgi:hypothetical protein
MITQMTVKSVSGKTTHMAPFPNDEAAREYLRARRSYWLEDGSSVSLKRVESREEYADNRFAAGIMTPNK